MDAATTIKAIQGSGLDGTVQMILVVALLILFILGPASVLFYRLFNNFAKDSKKDSSEGSLYQHLSEQVATLTARLDKVHEEYNLLFQENSLLTARVHKLETCEAMVERLQLKLNEKDVIIEQRDTQLNVLFSDLRIRDHKILELQERIHVLELRLARDERDWDRDRDDGK